MLFGISYIIIIRLPLHWHTLNLTFLQMSRTCDLRTLALFNLFHPLDFNNAEMH